MNHPGKVPENDGQKMQTNLKTRHLLVAASIEVVQAWTISNTKEQYLTKLDPSKSHPNRTKSSDFGGPSSDRTGFGRPPSERRGAWMLALPTTTLPQRLGQDRGR